MDHYNSQPELPFKYASNVCVRSVILCLVLAVLASYSLLLQLTQEGFGMMFFFTFWNNIAMLMFPYLKNTRYARVPVVMSILVATVYIVVETSSHFTIGLKYEWLSPRNILSHYICPALVLLIAYFERFKLPQESFLDFSVLIFYYCFVLFNINFLQWKLPLTNEYYPYFFMEPDTYPTWLTVIIATLLIGYFNFISRLLSKLENNSKILN